MFNHRSLAALLGMALGLAVVARPAEASFHLMDISEVLVGFGGDCRIQAVELRMRSPGQTQVNGHDVFFRDANDGPLGSFRLTRNMANGASGAHILIGTAEFAAISSVAPDFVMTEPFLRPQGGRVAFDAASASSAADSVAYGAYSGNNGGHGLPAAALSVASGLSLQRTAAGVNNAVTFALAAPTLTNNAEEEATLSSPAPTCLLTDDFADDANWDIPEPNAGLDLASCGQDVVIDIGVVEVAGGRLLVRPSLTPVPGVDAPLGIVGLSTDAAAAFATRPSYRVEFDFLAQPGILGAAFFIGQHHSFDADERTMSVGPGDSGGGFGFTISFDCPHALDRNCNHLHADLRTFCLQEVGIASEDSANFPGGLLTVSNERYTAILDAEGDDVAGPYTMSVKVFRAADPEPQDYLGTWKVAEGLGVSEDPEFDHGVLMVSIGAADAALEISDLSACEIPARNRHVRCLTCTRDIAGRVIAAWQNAAGEEEGAIEIWIDGVLVDTLDGDATEYEIEDPPERDFTIEVVNGSCIGVTCDVCFNDPPVVAIDGPSEAVLDLETGSVTVRLDASASTDGDDGSQGLFAVWTVTESPPGAQADVLIVDAEGLVIDLTVDTNGDYAVSLTVSDTGCPDDLEFAETTVVHDLRVAAIVTDIFFRRGDVDRNRVLELTDAVSTLNFLFLGGPPPRCFDAADSDDNGVVELTDAVRSLGFLFLGNPPPPAPGPMECGADPTADALAECDYDAC